MLQQFSWAQFLISAAILSLLWYIGVFLTTYRKETLGFLSGKAPGNKRAVEQDFANIADKVPGIEPELMGRSKMSEGLAVVSIDQISFAPGQNVNSEDEKSDQLGLVPDVLQELKEIFEVLEKEDGTKNDFFSLVSGISERYGRIASNPNIGRINEFIRERAPFAISTGELENLWD